MHRTTSFALLWLVICRHALRGSTLPFPHPHRASHILIRNAADGMKDRPGTRTHTRLVKPASVPDYSQKRSDGLFPRQRYLSSENTLDGFTRRFRGVLGSMYGLPHASLQRTEAVIAVIVPVHHAAQMMLAGETALVTQRPGIVIGTTTLPCFCSRCDWHAEVKQSSMRTARAVIFRQVFGIAFLPSCSKVQAGRRER